MRIERKEYLDRLVRRMWNGSIKVVTGVRRCGKSYLIFNLFRDYLARSGVDDRHVIVVELDRLENESLREKHALLEHITKRVRGRGRYYILIDEIQLVPGFEDVLNSLMHIENADTYVTGSNSEHLSSDINTNFRGRGDEVHIAPLSFSEYRSAHGGTDDEAWNDYILYGGLPKILSCPDDEAKQRYLENVFRRLYVKDIRDRINLRNDVDLSELVEVIASSAGSLTNAQRLADTFLGVKRRKMSDKTVAKYLNALGNAYLTEKVRRYDVRGRKYIGAIAKYYFTDLGIRNFVLSWRQVEENHLMENAIYNELRFRGFNVDVGVVEVWGTDKAGKRIRVSYEVDFVCTQGSRKYYVQSAFAMPTKEKQEQEQRSLNYIDDSFRKIIVERSALKPRRTEKGVLVLGLFDFLLHPETMDL